MRNTCAQSGRCQFCGDSIYRFSPMQNWYSEDKSEFWEAYECRENDGGRHKLAPR